MDTLDTTVLLPARCSSEPANLTNISKRSSSVSCAKKYFQDEGTGIEQLVFFWESAAKYGCVDVMEWAHRQGYSAAWEQENDACGEAAWFGQLQALQWLRENGCIFVLLLLMVAISQFSNGQERTDATGVRILVLLLLMVAISPFFNR